jgi:FkbM family methyltransferase
MLLKSNAIRSRLLFELRQHYYDEFDVNLPIGQGLKCPICFWEAWSSYGHIFWDGEYSTAFKGIDLPKRWIDIGCYAGYFSLFVEHLRASAGLPSDSEVLLIDADSRTESAVAKLIDLNHLTSRWKFQKAVIGRKSGYRWFVEREFMQSSLSMEGEKTRGAKRIEVIPSQKILKELEPPYDLIKLDIEGGEFEFLEAYGDVLMAAEYLVLEWHGWHPGGGGEPQLRKMVEQYGFRFIREVLAPHEAQHRSGPSASGVHLYKRDRESTD